MCIKYLKNNKNNMLTLTKKINTTRTSERMLYLSFKQLSIYRVKYYMKHIADHYKITGYHLKAAHDL